MLLVRAGTAAITSPGAIEPIETFCPVMVVPVAEEIGTLPKSVTPGPPSLLPMIDTPPPLEARVVASR